MTAQDAATEVVKAWIPIQGRMSVEQLAKEIKIIYAAIIEAERDSYSEG